MISFFKSGRFPFKGIRYVFGHKPLFRFLLIPVTIDFIISIALLVLIFFQIPELVNLLLDWLHRLATTSDSSILKWAIDWGGWLLKIALILISILIFPILLTICSAIIDPIFRGLLYSKVRELEGCPEEKLSTSEQIIRALKSIVNEIKKLLLYLVIFLLLLPLNLIPLIGSVCYLVLQFLVTSVLIGWEYLTPYLDEKKLSFSEQHSYVKKNKGMIMGFGIPGAMLLLIPVVQAFFLSTHTVGGALLSVEIEKKKAKA